ncbi:MULTISPECIES: type II toxin-antitoxin system PemK/MazF family toxin [Nocardia]|uniref:type II toxin-antitoxin system PemK/MazF family toxin n=1 Tax=Nocardia TaxID=1817 RepID=UPI000BEF7CE9|nr:MULTISPECIES: type II toxin-antitoxin system PemK/MazF family toxin [Nocardia]MBF6189484.1 type II toxin-antitoxin system PemK/MazF family toxin [Nocardia farcinica]MBF6315143.1 type II toxin-antitoxin system PemK/MazF family toxin [Nocardia farcinica]MBF6407560.1 type II toxin-antitoxin system PemK/MazF family toxin [Nocardia farcinica]PEH78584.1 mRNA interferase MazF1 [Nocardia sp. FDAARGOS_372]UEX23211.1 type II toxin-antitoxin system PemK/MazF family toxin [Nocardia farcinica]
MNAPVRGQVYRADLGYGPKPWLIVSNNQRNRVTLDVLAVRITTTRRELPTWVELGSNEPLTGFVNTDNIETLAKDELGDYLGSLSASAILEVNRALTIALGIP